MGLGADTLGVVFMEPYREKVCGEGGRFGEGSGGFGVPSDPPTAPPQVLAAVEGTPRAGLVRRFLDSAVAVCPDLSYEQSRMTAMGFGDGDVTYGGAPGGAGGGDSGSPGGVWGGCSPPWGGVGVL